MATIGILGCGTVGGGLIRLLAKDREAVTRTAGEEIKIKRVLARTPEKAFALGLSSEQVTESFEDILNDPEIDIVVELMGGVGFAYDCIAAALRAKKSVVTGNKDLIELRWDELHELARQNGVALRYEASVGGAIPVIGPIRDTLAGNVYTRIEGILNGTTNYILSSMEYSDESAGTSYEQALETAKKLGYAEADPTNDVEGLDAARKIAILARLAFGADVPLESVDTTGITSLTGDEFYLAKYNLNCTIKLIACAQKIENGVCVSVRPTLVPERHPLHGISGATNAVYLATDNAGSILLTGAGAGADATASSVAGDIIAIVRGAAKGDPAPWHSGCAVASAKSVPVRRCIYAFCGGTLEGDMTVRQFISGILTADKATAALDGAGIRYESVESTEIGGMSAVVIITAPLDESGLDAALAALGEVSDARKLRSLPFLS